MKRLPAFSLIEVSLVLLIVGVLAGVVLKGHDLLESARVSSALQEFQRIKMIILNYQEHYQALPGDDNKAILHLGEDAKNGNGNGIIDKEDSLLVWQHLYLAGFHKSKDPLKSKLNGQFVVGSELKKLPGLWMALAAPGSSNNALLPALTPKQAQALKLKAGEDHPQEGMFYVIEGDNVSVGECIQNNTYRLDHNRPTCIVLQKI